MTTSAWSPHQYERFKSERAQPFFDLLALVRPIPGGRAIDLGCGTGELTRVLHQTVGARSTVGLDNSETMLAGSREFATSGLSFKLGSILRFAPRSPFDLVFSNAALQWLPDHRRLFERLTAGLAPGGQLAVQMPANHDHPSHTIAFALAQEEPWQSELSGYNREWPVQLPEWYAGMLDHMGYVEQTVRLQVYAHHLGSRADVVEWVRGTLLTDYQQRMSEPAFAAFLQEYRQRLVPQLEDTRPYFYPFKRILIWARREGANLRRAVPET